MPRRLARVTRVARCACDMRITRAGSFAPSRLPSTTVGSSSSGMKTNEAQTICRDCGRAIRQYRRPGVLHAGRHRRRRRHRRQHHGPAARRRGPRGPARRAGTGGRQQEPLGRRPVLPRDGGRLSGLHGAGTRRAADRPQLRVLPRSACWQDVVALVTGSVEPCAAQPSVLQAGSGPRKRPGRPVYKGAVRHSTDGPVRP